MAMLSAFGGINVGFKQSNIPYIEISHWLQKGSKKGKACEFSYVIFHKNN